VAGEIEMKAKRGDLAVIVSHISDFVIGQPMTTHDQVEVCVVTSVTRDGVIKAVRRASWAITIEMRRLVHPHETYVVPQADVDVEAAMETAAANPWPTSGTPGKYYDSLDEVKAMLRGLRSGVAA
jgi:hypothetical protein